MLFNQGKQKSSFLVSFIRKEDVIVAVGLSIVHDNDTISLVNRFNFYLIILALIIVLITVWIYAKKIIGPLEELNDTAEDISNLNFKTVDIKTGDEIEELSCTINIMSQKLEQSHRQLKEKNESLKNFIANITHEIKSPLALIKAYSVGVQDGYDDSTYLDIIIKQTDNIAILLDDLLDLSKLEKRELGKSYFDIGDLITSLIEDYYIELKKKGIELTTNGIEFVTLM